MTPQETNIPGRRNHAHRGARRANGKSDFRCRLQFAGARDVVRRSFAVEFRPFQSPFVLPRRRPEIPPAHAARIVVERGRADRSKSRGCSRSNSASASASSARARNTTATFYSQIQTGFEVYLRKRLLGTLGRTSCRTPTKSSTFRMSLRRRRRSFRRSPASNASSEHRPAAAARHSGQDHQYDVAAIARKCNMRFSGGPLGGSKINNNYSFEFRGSQYLPGFRNANASTRAAGPRWRGAEFRRQRLTVPYYNQMVSRRPDDVAWL